MSDIAIIPARGGSTRIPGKNIKLFHGHPIIAHSIHAANLSNLFSKVYVSTDDDEIARVAMEWGASVLRRPAELCDSLTGTQAVMKHHLTHDTECILGVTHACCIYATAPMLNVADLHNARQALNGGFAYAFGVNPEPLFDAGQFYYGWAKAFQFGAPLISLYSRMVPVEADRVCDINTPEDWARAEVMYSKLKAEGRA